MSQGQRKLTGMIVKFGGNCRHQAGVSGRKLAKRRAAAGMSASLAQRPPPNSPELLTAEPGWSPAPAGEGKLL